MVTKNTFLNGSRGNSLARFVPTNVKHLLREAGTSQAPIVVTEEAYSGTSKRLQPCLFKYFWCQVWQSQDVSVAFNKTLRQFSAMFVATKKLIFLTGSQNIFSAVWSDRTGCFKQDARRSPTLTKCFLCLNLIRAITLPKCKKHQPESCTTPVFRGPASCTPAKPSTGTDPLPTIISQSIPEQNYPLMEQFDIMGDTFIRFPAKCKTKRSIALLNVRVESIFSDSWQESKLNISQNTKLFL